MTKKVILSTVLGFIFMVGIQAQEKKKKSIDPNTGTSLQIKKADAVQHPEADVNFTDVQNTSTIGQDVITTTTLSLDGIVVGDKRSSSPLNLNETRIVSIEFKSDNPNALYYLVDRLDNVILPASNQPFKEELRAGQYFLMVGLISEAAQREEKATYSFMIR